MMKSQNAKPTIKHELSHTIKTGRDDKKSFKVLQQVKTLTRLGKYSERGMCVCLLFLIVSGRHLSQTKQNCGTSISLSLPKPCLLPACLPLPKHILRLNEGLRPRASVIEHQRGTIREVKGPEKLGGKKHREKPGLFPGLHISSSNHSNNITNTHTHELI